MVEAVAEPGDEPSRRGENVTAVAQRDEWAPEERQWSPSHPADVGSRQFRHKRRTILRKQCSVAFRVARLPDSRSHDEAAIDARLPGLGLGRWFTRIGRCAPRRT